MCTKVFLKELGGGTIVARALSESTGEELDREAVYKWGDNGRIPYKWRPSIIELAKQKKVELPPTLQEWLPEMAAQEPAA